MLFYKRSCDLPKSMTLTLFKCFLCFLGITEVDGQAFTFSQIALSRPESAVGATLQANCNATYLASTPFVMDWRINNTVVGLYQITNNMVPQLANGTHHYDVVFSAPTTTIKTGNMFEVNLEIRNLKLNDDHTAISVTCTNCVQVSTLINVTECQLDNSSGVIASDVVSPCGLGCQVQYSCKSGYTGPIINATCLADATFDATPSCVQITCPAQNICSQPQYCFDVTMSNYNTTVLRQCEDGYNGTVTATCGIDSNWDVSSQCQAIPVCNVFDISSNKTLGRCVSETANVVQGHSVNVTCCAGFNGTATIATCLLNRMWDNLPICKQIPAIPVCNVSDISSNKTLGRCVSETGSLLQGSNVNVTCCPGFNGTATIATCLPNRMWDNLPTCIQDKSGLEVWIIIVIVVVPIIIILLIIFILCLFIKRCRALCCCSFVLCGKKFGEKDKRNSATNDETKNNGESVKLDKDYNSGKTS